MGSLLVTGIGQLVTLEGTSRAPVRGVTAAHVLGTLQDAWMLVEDGFISRIGTGRPPPSPGGNRMDVGGRAIIPGFVDCHTHSIFSGWRLDEYELRLEGADYLEILKAGGGILSTVETTRGATEGDLLDQGRQRLREFALQGTTTVEVKSGYGLDEETEFRMLKVIADLSREGPVETIPTFLGAHAVPLEHRDDPQAYVDHLISSTLPRVAREGMAQFVDVFCEEGAFTPEQSRQILEAASRLGLKGRLHADEMAGGGGAELGVRLGAASVDHLVHVSEEGIRALAESDTIAVVLPGTSFFLGLDRHAPARRLWDEGAALAISTDFNPGSRGGKPFFPGNVAKHQRRQNQSRQGSQRRGPEAPGFHQREDDHGAARYSDHPGGHEHRHRQTALIAPQGRRQRGPLGVINGGAEPAHGHGDRHQEGSIPKSYAAHGHGRQGQGYGRETQPPGAVGEVTR